MAALPSLRATASLGDLRLGTLEVDVALLHTLLQLGCYTHVFTLWVLASQRYCR